MMPMIRLEVEGMRYSVIHAFTMHSVEIQQALDKALEKALSDFDFAAVVKAEADRVLRESVVKAVASVASSLMWSEPIASIIRDGAAQKVREAIEKSLGEAKQ